MRKQHLLRVERKQLQEEKQHKRVNKADRQRVLPLTGLLKKETLRGKSLGLPKYGKVQISKTI